MQKSNPVRKIYSLERSARMNPNETRGEAESTIGNDTCPTCGMVKAQWGSRKGRGFEQGGETYCCRACAEGASCLCEKTGGE